MYFRAKIETLFRTFDSTKDNIDILFIQEILDTQMVIESLSALSEVSERQSFILKGSTSKKLKTLREDIVLAFKNHKAYIEIEFLELKMSEIDSNPSKRE